MSWIFGSLLLSSVIGVVFCDNYYTDLAANIINNSNRYFRSSNLSEYELADFVTSSVHFKNGRIGNLATQKLLTISRFVSQPNQDGVTYDFNVGVGLKKCTVYYQFQVRLTEISGEVSVDVGKNSFQLEGKVNLAEDGTCTTVLKDAHVLSLDGFQTTIKDGAVHVPYRKDLFELMFNSLFEKDFVNLLNLQILGDILTHSFKEKFNDIVCSQIKRATEG